MGNINGLPKKSLPRMLVFALVVAHFSAFSAPPDSVMGRAKAAGAEVATAASPNGYYNTARRHPYTGANYDENSVIAELVSSGTWGTSTESPTAIPNSGNINMSTSNARYGSDNRYAYGEGPNGGDSGYGGGYGNGGSLYIGGQNWAGYYRYRSGMGDGAEFAIYDQAEYSDIALSIGLEVPSNQTGGIVFRYQDPKNFYYLKVEPDASPEANRVRIGKVENGVDTVLHSHSGAVNNNAVGNGWRNWRLTVVGNRVTLVRANDLRPFFVAPPTNGTIFDNVVLDLPRTFSKGKCGLWAVNRSTSVRFNQISIASRDNNYTISNKTWNLTSGSYGNIKRLTANSLFVAHADYPLEDGTRLVPILNNEEHIRAEMGYNKYLGEIRFRYRKGGGQRVFANTGESEDIRTMSFNEDAQKIGVHYSGESRRDRGIRDFSLNQTYSLGTDPKTGDYVQIDIELKNTSRSRLEFEDIGMPMSWNSHWSGDMAYKYYMTSGANCISYNGSYITTERTDGRSQKIVFMPDQSTDTQFEYRRFQPSQGGAAMPEIFYMYSKAVSATDRLNQSYLPNTSLILAPGESKKFGFRIFITEEKNHLGINDILASQGSIAPVVNPGLVMPLDIVAEVDLRTVSQIVSLEDVTPNPSAHGMDVPQLKDYYKKNPNSRATFVKDIAKTNAINSTRGSSGDHNLWKITFSKLGRNDIQVNYLANGKPRKTVLQFWVMEPMKDLVQRRADFLMDHCFIDDDFVPSERGITAEDSLRYISRHKYTFLEVDNITGTAKKHGGDAFDCNNNMHEQHYDETAYMAAKNKFYPVKRELEALEKHFIDYVYEYNIRKFGSPQVTGNPGMAWETNGGTEGSLHHACCPGNTYWGRHLPEDPSKEITWRVFNYMNMAAGLFSMYEAMKYQDIPDFKPRWEPVDYLKLAGMLAWRGVAASGATGHMNDWCIHEIYEALLEEDLAGREGTIYLPTLVSQNLTTRTCENIAVLLRGRLDASSKAKGNADYPFTSEFAYDSTGEEGAYTYVSRYYNNPARLLKVEQTLQKTMAWISKTPIWYLQATGHPQGNDTWVFKYAVGLQGQIINEWHLHYADTSSFVDSSKYRGTNRYSQDNWRFVFPPKIASFANIQSGQPELQGPANTTSVMHTPEDMRSKYGVGVLGTNWGNYKPNRPYDWNHGFPYSESAESSFSQWGGFNILSADIVPNDPSFGLTGWGCLVETKATSGRTVFGVVPQDGLFRRINIVGDVFTLDLKNDRYTYAEIGTDYRSLYLELENASKAPHKGVAHVRNLKNGTYDVYVNGALAYTKGVANRIDDRNLTGFTMPEVFEYDISGDTATMMIVEKGINATAPAGRAR
ncbi:MAG: DUF5695 domain-containing protein [Holophagaceae bacterium]|nr:DUF5695 domain-containing protein [Holophagaceae bacterium]